ncbi:MAG: glycosyltransferase [Terrimicrobiaceae bacterium]|nr:glycosyltransferase [Terrimicrobiaceae bacterium]
MKILFDCHMPFQLAHGGAQTQIEETMRAVAGQGVEVEPIRWWDDGQTGVVHHVFGLPNALYSEMAHRQGRAVVATVLLTSNCNHPVARLKVQGWIREAISRVPGGRLFRNQTHWGDYGQVDRFVVGLEAEARVLTLLYGVPRERISIVPLGLPSEFLNLPPAPRVGDFLITTGTITDRKRSVDLAEMAIRANVPILFVGKPYSCEEPYWKQFQSLVDGRIVQHQPHVADRTEMIRLLQSSRGFVIFSRHENWCLSAHEAAACGVPILVQDQPWARECFGTEAHYLSNDASPENVERLAGFYRSAPSMQPPKVRRWSWDDVARQLLEVYRLVRPS